MKPEDIRELQEEGFSSDQIVELAKGSEKGVDISKYRDKDYIALQMEQIRLGLEEGLPVDKYRSKEFDWFQMEEIRLGLHFGVRVDVYAKPEVTYPRMRQMRLGLQDGINLSPYIRFDAGVLKQLRLSYKDKVDMIGFMKQGYTEEQLEPIRYALTHNLDIEPYITPEFHGAAIMQIVKGLEKGLPVAEYADVKRGWREMREIRLGMEHRVQVSMYSSIYYNWKQMREIRLGLERGINVSEYAKLMYTNNDMAKKRKELEEKLALDLVINGGNETSVFEDYFISVSPNGMEAKVEVMGAIRSLDRTLLARAMKEAGVTHGFIRENLKLLHEGSYDTSKVVVAKGRKAENGKDGWYEFFYEEKANPVPTLLEDGSVDYQNMQFFDRVEKGATIAIYHPAETGADGITVTGEKLIATKGKELPVLTGKGFQVQEDKCTYVASVSGRYRKKQNQIEITNMLEVDEVTTSTGNVIFDGNVHVKGNVGTGAMIQVTEDVVIDGVVESAMISAGGNIVVKCGVTAGNMGFLKAKGDIQTKFIESGKLTAGNDIKANYSLNSELFANGQIVISGNHGSITGGVATAERGIMAENIGNRVGVHTHVKVGVSESMMKEQRDMESKLNQIGHELLILMNALNGFKEKLPPEVRNTNETYLKVEQSIFAKNKEKDELKEKIKEHKEKMSELIKSSVVAHGTLFDGVKVEVNGAPWNSPGNSKNVTVKMIEDQVVMINN